MKKLLSFILSLVLFAAPIHARSAQATRENVTATQHVAWAVGVASVVALGVMTGIVIASSTSDTVMEE